MMPVDINKLRLHPPASNGLRKILASSPLCRKRAFRISVATPTQINAFEKFISALPQIVMEDKTHKQQRRQPSDTLAAPSLMMCKMQKSSYLGLLKSKRTSNLWSLIPIMGHLFLQAPSIIYKIITNDKLHL